MSRNERDSRIPRLLKYLEPYYLRIRKSDLHYLLWITTLRLIDMSPLQERIYKELEVPVS